MIIHYLKIAFRNMWKYKSQSLISIIGLAVGFTCFALAMLWIVYEMTYDSFHKNAKQMYVVYIPSPISIGDHDKYTTYLLADYLKETFPEIADAIPLEPAWGNGKVKVEDVEFSGLTIRADSSFFRMFDVKILEGNKEFLIPGNNKIAITQEKARQLFGNEIPIGKTVNTQNSEFTICAIVSGMSKRSNYLFDFIAPFREWQTQGWTITSLNTVIKLVPGINIEAFEKKLYEHDLGEGTNIYCEKINTYFKEMTIKPITKLRYTDPKIEREVKFQYILIFALSGLLVILCSFFNYLTLFMSRFRMRQKELALRVVCGASGGSLLVMLSVEFMLTLLFAVVFGFCFTQLALRDFLTLSEIKMNLSDIYGESLIYIGGVILISLLAFWLVLFIFRHKSLNISIRRSNKKLSRKISVVVQLLISVGFTFCTIIILKQIYFLHNSADLGFSFKNRGWVTISLQEENSGVFANQLKQIPEITEVIELKGLMSSLLPPRMSSFRLIDSWDDKPINAVAMNTEIQYVSPEYIDFYEFQLLEGEMLTDFDPDSLALLNESAVKAFGWYAPVGKIFGDNNYAKYYTVKGVIKNVYNYAPTIPAKPVIYLKYPPDYRRTNVTILFKCREGMWKTCKEKIEQIFETEYASYRGKVIFNDEEEYNKLLKSENALLKLLTFVSAICVLICVFGFVSLVSLTCEERRKEIAIRKINGATSGDILSMFAKEYFILLLSVRL